MKKYYIKTFGCQMNHSDSERLQKVLASAGYKKVDEQSADFIIFNMCSVRQSAVDRVLGQARNAKQKKKQVFLTGCILPIDKKKFENKVDLIFNITDMQKLPEMINGLQKNKKIADYLTIIPSYSKKYTALVPIMTGCNNFCSYCAVPYTRGRERSRPVADILQEVNNLIVQGIKEIILLGQNVNSYQSGTTNFPALLKKIENISGDWWLSFVSSHPKDVSNELIACCKKRQHLVPYFHLALQSGSDKILKKMNRHYSAKQFVELTDKIKKVCPSVALTTDVIVGFPNESEKDFLQTKKVMKQVEFDMAFIAQFSPRIGTAAAQMKDNVPKDVKKIREKELTEVLKQTALTKNKKLINKKIMVLLDRVENKNVAFGHTNQFKNVKIKGEFKKSDVGCFKEVKITTATVWNLQAELL